MSEDLTKAIATIMKHHRMLLPALEALALIKELKRREQVSPGRSAGREAVGVPPDVSARPGEPS